MVLWYSQLCLVASQGQLGHVFKWMFIGFLEDDLLKSNWKVPHWISNSPRAFEYQSSPSMLMYLKLDTPWSNTALWLTGDLSSVWNWIESQNWQESLAHPDTSVMWHVWCVSYTWVWNMKLWLFRCNTLWILAHQWY